jgi:hypothetical protein
MLKNIKSESQTTVSVIIIFSVVLYIYFEVFHVKIMNAVQRNIRNRGSRFLDLLDFFGFFGFSISYSLQLMGKIILRLK